MYAPIGDPYFSSSVSVAFSKKSSAKNTPPGLSRE
jgi:hypothetical protein